MQEQILTASRRTIGYHALLCGVLLAVSLGWIAAGFALHAATPDIRFGRGDGRMFEMAAVGVVVFGAALAASLARLVRPYRLIIGKEALVVERSFRRPRRIAWADVQEFFVSGDAKSPGISLRYDRAHGLTGLAMGGGFGTENALPVGEFGMPAYAIAELLNEARREGVEAAPTAPAPALPEPPQPQIVS